MDILSPLWDFLFPPRCPHCRRYTEQNGEWCADCLREFLAPCRLALEPDLPLDYAYTLGRYAGTLRDLLRRLKFQRDMAALPPLRYFMARAWANAAENVFSGGDFSPLTAESVAPIPLHIDREQERGFNQAELLWRDFFAAPSYRWRPLLCRVRATQPQYGLNRAARLANLDRAFALMETADVAGRDILVVDDIFTSGATLGEAARALKAAGAHTVGALTVASRHDRL